MHRKTHFNKHVRNKAKSYILHLYVMDLNTSATSGYFQQVVESFHTDKKRNLKTTYILGRNIQYLSFCMLFIKLCKLAKDE